MDYHSLAFHHFDHPLMIDVSKKLLMSTSTTYRNVPMSLFPALQPLDERIASVGIHSCVRKRGVHTVLAGFPNYPFGQACPQVPDSQWPGFTVALGNIYAAYYFCMIALFLKPCFQINEVLFKVLAVFLISHVIDPSGRFLVKVTVGLAKHLTIQKTIQALEALLLISSCDFAIACSEVFITLSEVCHYPGDVRGAGDASLRRFPCTCLRISAQPFPCMRLARTRSTTTESDFHRCLTTSTLLLVITCLII